MIQRLLHFIAFALGVGVWWGVWCVRASIFNIDVWPFRREEKRHEKKHDVLREERRKLDFAIDLDGSYVCTVHNVHNYYPTIDNASRMIPCEVALKITKTTYVCKPNARETNLEFQETGV